MAAGKGGDIETQRKKIWYGLTAEVTFGPGRWHRTGFGKVVFPHPPAANWLLRFGMSNDTKRGLVFAHEFAHFETAPFALLYMGALLAVVHPAGRSQMASILMVIVSTHAAWEILAESLVVLKSPEDYRQLYNSLPQLPRLLFWLIGTVLAAAGWISAI